MIKKTKKKSTTSSFSVLSLPSEPAPASSETAQPPLSTSSAPASHTVSSSHSSQESACSILDEAGIYFEFQTAIQIFLSDRDNVSEANLARFFNFAYRQGVENISQQLKERIQGIRADACKEGKEAERLKWVQDGHVAGKECKANQNECTSIAIETDAALSSPPIIHPATTTTASATVQTEPVIEKPVSLDWAEEMSAVPIHSIVTAPRSASPSRDISVLHSSESTRLFASLQRRHVLMRHIHPRRSSQPSRVKYPFSKLPLHMSQPTSSIPQDTPPCFSSQSLSHSHSHYNWASNLFVLSDLATALGEMGWRPPGFFCPRF
jgi:hypothetical protein